MKTRATVRVRKPPGQSGSNRFQLQQAADLLEKNGFTVLRIGRVGVSVEADEQVFKETLGVKLPTNAGAVVIPTRPTQFELSNFIDLVEVTPKPTIF